MVLGKFYASLVVVAASISFFFFFLPFLIYFAVLIYQLCDTIVCVPSVMVDDWPFIADESEATASPTVKKRLSARMKSLASSAFLSFSMTSARGLTNTSCHNPTHMN